MKIIKVIIYRDGGTLGIITNEGMFYLDRRMLTSTPHAIFDDYPNKGTEVQPLIAAKVKKALEDWNFFYD